MSKGTLLMLWSSAICCHQAVTSLKRNPSVCFAEWGTSHFWFVIQGTHNRGAVSYRAFPLRATCPCKGLLGSGVLEVLPDLQPSGELGCKEYPEKQALELTWQSQYVKATAAACDLSHLKACSARPRASLAEGTL